MRGVRPLQTRHVPLCCFVLFLLVSNSERGELCQGGLLAGKDPTQYDTADPLRLWLIQVGQTFNAFLEVVTVLMLSSQVSL